MEENQRTGFAVSFLSRDVDYSEGAPGLPEFIPCDSSLDQSLGRIKTLLKKWITSQDASDAPRGVVRHLSMQIMGPLAEEECVSDQRTPEQRLAEADSPEERLRYLSEAAQSRFGAGDYEAARAHAIELEQLLPTVEEDLDSVEAASWVQTMLGRLAFVEGNVEEAKRRLIESANTSNPSLLSLFSPDMRLAKDLLLAGEKQIVLDYFEACRKFWKSGSEQLDIWAMYVNVGRIPDFDKYVG